MRSKSSLLEPLALLQMALALFFGISGLLYFLDYSTFGSEMGRALGKMLGRNEILITITAVIQLAAGVILFIGLFAKIPTRYMFIAGMAILVLWIIMIIMSHFMNNFMNPEILPWFKALSFDVIILAGLWSIVSRYPAR